MPSLTLKAIAAAALLTAAYCAPAPVFEPSFKRRQNSIGGDNDIGPPGSSGQLRGPVNLGGYSPGNPVSSPDTVIPADQYQLAPGQAEDADLGLFLDLSDIENPQPIRGAGGKSPTDPGPRNVPLDRQNSDIFAPPGTDSGDVPQAKWPMGLSHNRHGLKGAGWARQQNVNNLPVATAMAGVDMRLEPHAYRELHWHKASEWSLILNGSVRLNAVNELGETFTDDLQAGDTWLFPAGVPHSIQALDEGVEFLLVFNDGSFSEDNTFLVSELMIRNPQSVIAKDLRVDTSALANLPQDELYIFPGRPAPANISAQNVTGPAGSLPLNKTYSYHLSQQEPFRVPGGEVKIIDSTSFPTSTEFAAALFTVRPGAMRELHWHLPNSQSGDEWSFFIQGQARLTVFSAPESSRTFDFQAGDVGYVPVPDAHYIENTGDVDLIYLEVLQAPVFNDVSVAQWLGLTPGQIVQDHLGFSQDTLNRLPKIKPYILPGSTNMTQTNFTAEAE
ncbi:oxalate decarboxylase, secreted [Myriangium duriaei CBS 260.36]|uniref:Oxalate decarboxylase, secreted n=1 Tax=Myriangium duriaei CBS 260.36 TaxID=1168546 RepID=A0A9P4J9U9_9PEZI|nr:oxalate decarboxylase, secreted [Myriangium duriaei CBS 260.36]